jgi:WD40 repeat protein
MKDTDSLSSVAFSPDGHLIAAVGYDKVILWETDRHKERLPRLFKDYGKKISIVAFSPDGQWLASGGSDHTVRLWDVNTGQEKSYPRPLLQSDEIESLIFSPNSRWVASGSADKRIKIWEADTGNEFAELAGHSGWVISLSFSPDSRTLAASDNDGSVKLWDVYSRTPVRTFSGYCDVESVAFSPDGRSVAWGTGNNIEFRLVHDSIFAKFYHSVRGLF